MPSCSRHQRIYEYPDVLGQKPIYNNILDQDAICVALSYVYQDVPIELHMLDYNHVVAL